MTEPTATPSSATSRSGQDETRGAASSRWRVPLLALMVLGLVVALAMVGEAFGPSGVTFGLILGGAAFALVKSRYRFSLRTYLVTTTALGIWLGVKVNRDMELERALTGLLEAGGHFRVSGQRADFPWGFSIDQHHLDFFDLATPLDNSNLAHLEAIPPVALLSLGLENTGITDESLGPLGRFTYLKTLSLGNATYMSGDVIPNRPQNHITDEGLRAIRGLSELHGLQLGGTDISDDGLQYLSHIDNLYFLELPGTDITGTGVSHLRSLQKLGSLDLSGCKITPEGFEEILKLKTLTSLYLRNTDLTDQDLDRLSRVPQLQILDVRNNQISNNAIQRFRQTNPKCRIQ